MKIGHCLQCPRPNIQNIQPPPYYCIYFCPEPNTRGHGSVTFMEILTGSLNSFYKATHAFCHHHQIDHKSHWEANCHTARKYSCQCQMLFLSLPVITRHMNVIFIVFYWLRGPPAKGHTSKRSFQSKDSSNKGNMSPGTQSHLRQKTR